MFKRNTGRNYRRVSKRGNGEVLVHVKERQQSVRMGNPQVPSKLKWGSRKRNQRSKKEEAGRRGPHHAAIGREQT